MHNEIQDLRGNVRVVCRIRPKLDSEKDECCLIEYEDQNSIINFHEETRKV